jgi:signal transduction histidine kinase
MLLLIAALVVAVGGMHLAWQPQELRYPSDRAVLRNFATQTQEEINRLGSVLEDHLLELAAIEPADDELTIKKELSLLFGAAEWTRMQDGLGMRPVRVRSPSFSNPLPPEVSWKRAASFSVSALEMATVLGYDAAMKVEDRPAFLKPEEGWERPEASPWAFFWKRDLPNTSSAQATVITIYGPTIVEVMNRHLQEWAAGAFKPVAALKGLDFLEAPNALLLAGAMDRPLNRTPDFLAPVSSPWGEWQVVSWDRLETKAGWKLEVLTASALVAGVLAITALLVFVQLRRAWRQAEERVSFINRVSHDLGTPLTNMMLNLDLAKDAVEVDPAACGERLDLVAEEGKRLARLVENVLTHSRGGRQGYPLAAVPTWPQEVIERCVATFRPSLERRGVKISLLAQATQQVMMDPDAFAQILSNLISNVEKYAASGGVLEIQSEWAAGRLKIIVRDAGPGIPAADRERIFQPFVRLSQRVNEGASGTGLGLAIARELARQMGGELQCGTGILPVNQDTIHPALVSSHVGEADGLEAHATGNGPDDRPTSAQPISDATGASFHLEIAAPAANTQP